MSSLRFKLTRGSGWRYRLLVVLAVLLVVLVVLRGVTDFFGCLVVLLVVLAVILVVVATKKNGGNATACAASLSHLLSGSSLLISRAVNTPSAFPISIFWDSTVRIGCFSCDDVSFEKCLYTLEKSTQTRDE